MNEPDIYELAKRQLADYDAHRPGQMFEEGVAFLSVPQAYELQIEVAKLRLERGEPLAGYKVGCTSKAVRSQLGLEGPVFGHVFSMEIYRSGAVLDSASFANLAIEGEFAVRIREDIPNVEWLRKRRKGAVSHGLAVIELHNHGFWHTLASAQELIANNALHAGVVLPVRETEMQDSDELLDEPISVFQNGPLLGDSFGGALLGGPFASLLQLAEHLTRFGFQLKRGQLILLGSALPLFPVSPGDRIEVRCACLSGVEISIKNLPSAEEK